MIVDTSALVAILMGEPDAPVLARPLDSAAAPKLSAGSYAELCVVIDAKRNQLLSRSVDDLIKSSDITIEPVTEAQARIARQAYRDYGKGSGHRAGLNFGDCFAYALAVDKREPLLFKGDDFSHTGVRRVAPIAG